MRLTPEVDVVEKLSFTIDGLACRDFPTTIAEFNRAFGAWWDDGYWNGNLDVFNDIIDWPNDMQPYTLVWSNSASARDGLGHQAMAAWQRDALARCVPDAPNWDGGKRDLAEAERGRGPTLFDWLVEIICKHPQIDFRLE